MSKRTHSEARDPDSGSESSSSNEEEQINSAFKAAPSQDAPDQTSHPIKPKDVQGEQSIPQRDQEGSKGEGKAKEQPALSSVPKERPNAALEPQPAIAPHSASYLHPKAAAKPSKPSRPGKSDVGTEAINAVRPFLALGNTSATSSATSAPTGMPTQSTAQPAVPIGQVSMHPPLFGLPGSPFTVFVVVLRYYVFGQPDQKSMVLDAFCCYAHAEAEARKVLISSQEFRGRPAMVSWSMLPPPGTPRREDSKVLVPGGATQELSVINVYIHESLVRFVSDRTPHSVAAGSSQ